MEAKASELSASSPLLSIFSHPLYLSYFIFFFPYMVNLFSFLFPLLVAVSLLLLALYTLSPPLRQDYCDVSLFSDSKLGVFSAFQPFFEDFDACRNENGGNPDGFGDEKGEERAEFPPLTENLRENRAPDSTQISESKKKEEEEEEEKKLRSTENPSESEEKANSCRSSSRTKSMEDSQALALNIDGSPGSTRKQREWRRTLAFKLHEERRSVEENSERMDLLWETYEKEAERNRSRSSRKSKNGGLEKKEKETESDEEEEDSNGDLCCLQAFKISAGKMNLGMGKGKLVKFSKALRGIGWFSQVKVKPKHLTKRNANYFC